MDCLKCRFSAISFTEYSLRNSKFSILIRVGSLNALKVWDTTNKVSSSRPFLLPTILFSLISFMMAHLLLIIMVALNINMVIFIYTHILKLFSTIVNIFVMMSTTKFIFFLLLQLALKTIIDRLSYTGLQKGSSYKKFQMEKRCVYRNIRKVSNLDYTARCWFRYLIRTNRCN